MDGTESNMLLCDIARDIVADIAPQELPVFPAVSSAWLADPADTLSRRRRGEAALGFGAETVFALLTPAVLYVVAEVVKVLGDAAKKAVAEGLEREAMALVTAVFKRFRRPGQPPVPRDLVEAQFAAVRATVVRAGREMCLSDDKIEILAKAVAAQLVVPE